MWILSAGLHLFIAYPAAKDVPQHDMESRMLTLSGVDHLPDKLTYKQTYQIKGHPQEGLLFSQLNGQLALPMSSATTSVGLKILMVPRGAS